MGGNSAILTIVDAIAHEAILFAAIGFLIGGIDDLLVDLSYVVTRFARRTSGDPGQRPLAHTPMPMAVFIPAWDESNVIGDMLRATLSRWGAGAYRLYVGAYPNDPATIAAVAAVAETDPRVRLVIGPNPGPTTKADCLNTLWRALARDDDAGGEIAAVILHDAEDLVDPLELATYTAWLADHDAVQIPVRPLADPRSRLVAGHYIDEFAESHGKTLVARAALGAPLPFCGVGCAISRVMLTRIASQRGGAPFDAASLTEDYELGFTIATFGGRTRFARQRSDDGRLIAVRAYFPASLTAAVRQKARWMTGISLAGWDRIGWARRGSLADHWVRMHDRRATLAIPVLAVAYVALTLWGGSFLYHLWIGQPAPGFSAEVTLLLQCNLGLFMWRAAVRAMFTGLAAGPAEAALALPRMFVGNFIALMAARRAVALYWATLRGGPAIWDKTRHHFPDILAPELVPMGLSGPVLPPSDAAPPAPTAPALERGA